MSDASLARTPASPATRGPWHLWLVGILALLWNLSGAITIWLAQADRLQGISPDEAAYYAAQSWLFMALTDISLVGGLTGSVTLLMRRRAAMWFYGVSLVTVCITNSWDILAGSSRALANTSALVVTCLIFVLAILQFLYAKRMARCGILI